MFLSSCVSKKDFEYLQGKYTKSNTELERLTSELRNCNNQQEDLQKELNKLREDIKTSTSDGSKTLAELEAERRKVISLEQQLDFVKVNNANLLDRLSDLSIISKSGAESIKKSIDAMDRQSGYIQNLNSTMRRKDSTNLALVMNLKRSLGSINDTDVNIEVKKGVVYVSLSDKMLFQSGSSKINPSAQSVLSKIALVINDYSYLDVLVEGHTDNVPIQNGCVTDNWDLSAKRATEVVRTLQTKYGVQPSRMTAGGRGEFAPKSSNDYAEGRSMNRRTEIIILPKLDEFFKLLEAPEQ